MVLALRDPPGQSRGESWAGCEEHRAFIEGHLKNRVRLTTDRGRETARRSPLSTTLTDYSEAFRPPIRTVAWDGCDRNGRPVPAGIHFDRLRTAEGSRTRKLIRIE